ncbi:hypothetical protein DRW07_17935 [Alteromonas sediminis]|uniref:Uncharacterized protein n=1 Tax=Alteromonas sediminis TaxID=2259342 RepID=A0A3N5Z4A5_9ALTE|nr:hypothetical protein [Alteromonas sediminis]RPJ64804.1 hypothetical protein DRW07_17935 [Alteromonas sediminis]
MQHPFEITELTNQECEQAAGSASAAHDINTDSFYTPGILPPPIFITFALGEDGGELPIDDFV